LASGVMSLRGRYVIDRIKQAVGHRFRLPVPPYGDPGYWDGAYKSFGPQDSFEWGSVSLSDILEYNFKPLPWENEVLKDGTKHSPETLSSTTLGETLGVHPEAETDEPMLMLGCGNSRLGEEMIQHGWRGPLIQVDVSPRVIDAMSQRCGPLISNGHMNFVEDDATELTAFRSGMVNACLDKGLMDAVYCADEYEQCASILKSVHRVLKPGGTFIFLSFSRPEFLLPKVAMAPSTGTMTTKSRSHRRGGSGDANPLWENIQVQELPQILLYRFQKPSIKEPVTIQKRNVSPKNKGRSTTRTQ
jgi:ubiquinone/menaquinone biosynthesis C-methylase UbiE